MEKPVPFLLPPGGPLLKVLSNPSAVADATCRVLPVARGTAGYFQDTGFGRVISWDVVSTVQGT